MIGALAIKNRRKKQGLDGTTGEGPPPVPSPLANRVHMCYFVAACCIVVCIVIAIPAIVSDSNLFYYASISGGIGILLIIVTCFLSTPSDPHSLEQPVKVEPTAASKPPLLPSSPAPSSCSGKVYPRSTKSPNRSFPRSKLARNESSDTRSVLSRDQSLDISPPVSNVTVKQNESKMITSVVSTPPVVEETLIEMPPLVATPSETKINDDEGVVETIIGQ